MSVTNSFVSGTTMSSSDMNANFTDFAAEVTNSIAADGQKNATAPIKFYSGTVAAPGISWASDTDTGFYRIGGNNVGAAANGTKIWEWDATGLTIVGTLALKIGSNSVYSVSGTDVAVADGGTGVSALTAHYLPIGNGTSAVTLLAPSATSGVPLISQGASADPAYGTAVVAGGGTGMTSATAYAVLCGGTTSTGAHQSIAGLGSAGDVLTSNGAGALPTMQTPLTIGMVKLASGNASGATLDIVLTSYTAYKAIVIYLNDLVPATDDVDFYIRVSTDGGSNYDAGSNNYKYTFYNGVAGTGGTYNSAGATQIATVSTNGTAKIGNGAAEGISGVIRIQNQTNTSQKPKIAFDLEYYAAGDFPANSKGMGFRDAAQDTDAIRFLFSSGNISSGAYVVYGMA